MLYDKKTVPRKTYSYCLFLAAPRESKSFVREVRSTEVDEWLCNEEKTQQRSDVYAIQPSNHNAAIGASVSE